MNKYEEDNSNVISMIPYNKTDDFNHMIAMVKKNPRYYMQASGRLKNNYTFIMEAINSCLSEVNNMEDKNAAKLKLQSFLEKISDCSGVNMEYGTSEKNTLMARVKTAKTKTIYEKIFGNKAA